jgi:hypothetical protein
MERMNVLHLVETVLIVLIQVQQILLLAENVINLYRVITFSARSKIC